MAGLIREVIFVKKEKENRLGPFARPWRTLDPSRFDLTPLTGDSFSPPSEDSGAGRSGQGRVGHRV